MAHLLAGQLLGKKVSGAGVMGGGKLSFTDTFDRANGDLANGWQYTAGKWTVASNAAAGNPELGSELLTDPGFEIWTAVNDLTNWNENIMSIGGGNVLQNTIEKRAGTYCTRLVRANTDDLIGVWQSVTIEPGKWYLGSVYAKSNPTDIALNQQAINSSTQRILTTAYVQYVKTDLNLSAVGGETSFETPDGTLIGSVYIDDASTKALTTADLMCTRILGKSNVDISIPLTVSKGTQAGIIICLDNKDTPANLILAYHDGTNARLLKCVGGTYTSLINTAATYGAGQILRVVKSGTSVSLYYNGTQIGATQTVSDAGVIGNTRHGMFTTYSGNSIASFTAVSP